MSQSICGTGSMPSAMSVGGRVGRDAGRFFTGAARMLLHEWRDEPSDEKATFESFRFRISSDQRRLWRPSRLTRSQVRLGTKTQSNTWSGIGVLGHVESE